MPKIASALMVIAFMAFSAPTFCTADSSVSFSLTGVNPATGNSLSASVTFQLSGASLTVILTNTSTGNVSAPSDVLTAVFFNIAGNPTLSPGSAVLASGSSVLNCIAANSCTPPTAGDLGGEWAFKQGISGGPGGASYGISSSGFGIFGPFDLFGGPDLQPPLSPDGLQFGITSLGITDFAGNGGLGNSALIRNSVNFTFTVPVGFNLGSISDVGFAYGTGPDLVLVPEPGTLALLGTGLFGVAALLRRRLRS